MSAAYPSIKPSAYLCDVVPGQPLKPGAVGSPVGGAGGGGTPIVVEVYALGRGVTLAREKSDLFSRQGTLELKAAGHRFVIDPLACDHAHGLVVAVERYVRAIPQQLKAVDQKSAPKFKVGSSSHGSSSLKTAILQLPQGMGKSTMAPKLAKWLGCTTVVDEWFPGQAITPGALHLTSMEVPA